MKKLLSILIAAAMLLALLAGCGAAGSSAEASASAPAEEGSAAAPAQSGDKPSIGFIIMGMGNEFFESIKTTYEQVFEEAGWDHDFYNGDYDNAKIVEGIENYTAMGKDVIIVFPMSGEGIASAVHQAREAGIKVICMVEAPGDDWDAYMSSDDYVAGKANAWMCAQWIEKTYPDAEPGSIPVALIQIFDTVTDTDQSNGLEAITEYTDKANVIRYEITGQNTSDGQTAAENLYTTNPECKLFVTTSNAVALGVNSFYTAINSPADDLSEYGCWGTNASEEAINAIADSVENKSMLRGIAMQAGVEETVNDFLTLATGLLDGTIDHLEEPATMYLITGDNIFEFFEKGTVALQWDFDQDKPVEK